MNIITAADHGKTVAAQCRTTSNWVIGQVDVLGKEIRVLVNHVARPLRAFIRVMKIVASGMLTLLRGEVLRAQLCLNDANKCSFITHGGRTFTLKEFYSFDATLA